MGEERAALVSLSPLLHVSRRLTGVFLNITPPPRRIRFNAAWRKKIARHAPKGLLPKVALNHIKNDQEQAVIRRTRDEKSQEQAVIRRTRDEKSREAVRSSEQSPVQSPVQPGGTRVIPIRGRSPTTADRHIG